MIRFLAFCLLLCLFHSCLQEQPAASPAPSTKPISPSDPWLRALQANSDSLDLSPFYHPRAGLFTSGQFFQGHDSLHHQWQSLLQSYPVSSRVTSGKIYHDSAHYYELGQYLNADQKPTLAYLIAWTKKENEEWKRDLEILYPFQQDLQPIPREIDQARRRWEDYSNAHKPATLIDNCYTPEAIYFNGGRVTKGRAAITQRYQYMKRPQWEIQLHPREFMGISKDLVFEVGQYQSSGVGHYILFWQRQNDQIWQALLDHNF